MIPGLRLGFLLVLVALWALAAQSLGPNVVPTPAATLEAAGLLISAER